MFENKLTHNGIHYSRYIVSWKRSGGKIYRGGLFEQWLREKEQLTEDEIADILLLATNGKLELEGSAMTFMKANKEATLEERRVAVMGGYFEECTGTNYSLISELCDKVTSKYK